MFPLQASAGSGTDTRRVGPFTVEPQAARRLLMSHIEAAERKRAEEEIARLTGAQQVRWDPFLAKCLCEMASCSRLALPQAVVV